jgi:thiol-disulfide isomerase/thioredoxin
MPFNNPATTIRAYISMLKYSSPFYLVKNFWKDAIVLSLILVALTTWLQRDMLTKDSQVQNLILPSLSGKPQGILHPEKHTLVYFFAPWCSICKLSMGNLKSVDSNINTVAIALDYQHVDEVTQFINNIEVDVPVLLGNNPLASTFQVSAYPSYYIIDKQGKVLDRSMGYSSLAGLLWRTSQI